MRNLLGPLGRVLPILIAGAHLGCSASSRPQRPEAADPPTVPIPRLPLPPAGPAAPPEPGEPGLVFRLEPLPGGATGPLGERSGSDASPLPAVTAEALLDRLPPLSSASREDFRLPPGSPPPPRTGATVVAAFPPPDSLGPARPAEPEPDEERLEVLRVAPTGETELAPHVAVTFSLAMVPLTGVGALDSARVPVRLSPLPPGRWSWVDTRTVRFEPEGRLPMATRFVVEVPAGTRSAAGAPLGEPVRVEFATPPPTAVGGYPYSERAGPRAPPPPPRRPGREPPRMRFSPAEVTGLEPVILVVFDQRVDPAAVLRTTRLVAGSGPRALRLATAAEIAADSVVGRMVEAAPEGRWVAMRPVEPLPRATPVSVRVGPGTPSAEGPRATGVIQELGFHTYGPLEVRDHGCRADEPCPPGTPLWVSFSNPLDPGLPLDSLVRVEPAVSGLALDRSGSDLFLSGELRPRTTYRVTLDPRLRDRFGQRLGRSVVLTFAVGDLSPSLVLPGAPLVVLDPAGAPRLPVHTRGIASMRARVFRVAPEDWRSFAEAVRRYQERRTAGSFDPPGRLVVDTTLVPAGGREGFGITPIDLAPALPGGLGHAVVVVEAPLARPGPPERRGGPGQEGLAFAWVQGTRIGLSAMVDHDELLGWATSLQSGEPLAGVELRLLPSGAGATTGAGGLASIPLSPSGDHLLVGRRGADVALLPEHPYGGWWDEGSWRRRPIPAELRWLVFSDRGLYRPGERVHLKGWIRRAELGEEGDLELPRGLQRVGVTVTGPRREEVHREEVPARGLGGFSAAFDLPRALNLGHAGLQLEALGPGVPETGRRAWHSVQVQEFRRPEYEVSLEADPGPHVVGESIEASLRAAYYSGGGLPESAVTWRVRSSPGHFSPPGWEGWHFGRAPRWGPFTGEGGVRFETTAGVTDADGVHRVRIDLLEADPPFPSSLHAAAQVEDVNRQVGSAELDLLVHPAAVYAGLRTRRRWIEAGDSVAIELVAVELEGSPRAGSRLEVRAERMEWSNEPGRWGWRAAETLPVCGVVSASEPVRCAWRPARAGSYRLRAEVRDERGRTSRTELPVWVAGDGLPSGPERPDRQAVELIPDRAEYQPGEVAEVLVQVPFSPARGVLTLRRAGLLERRSFRVEGAAHRLRVPITEAHLAGVRLRVDLVDEERGTEMAAGEIRLSVPPSRRELSVRVTPRDSVVSPGDRTSVEVVVRDAAGRPAADAEVALWMVDEAVLSLGGYRLPDPLEVFYPDRAGGVRDYHLRPWVVLAPRSAGPGTVSGVLVGAETGEPLRGMRVVLEGTGIAAVTGANGSFTLTGVAPGRYDLSVQEFGPRRIREVEVPAEGVHLGTVVLSTTDAPARARGGAEHAGVAPPLPAPAAPRDVMGKAVALESVVVTGGAQEAVALREDFAPLAFFEAGLRTGPDGRARVAVVVPGTLTRYRVMAVAVQGSRRFGTGESTLTARRELMVRPSAPRFLNFGDRVEIPVLVQNGTDEPLQVAVAVRGSGLRLESPLGRRVTVPARDRVEIRFPAVADAAGTARVQAVAVAGSRTDAAAVDFPVYTPATTEAFATYGELDDSRPLVLPVSVPEGVVPGFGGLEVTVSSTAVQELTDAVLYLRSYPFEGAEQIASRVLGIAALREVLALFAAEGLPPPEEVAEAVRRDVRSLAALQGGDGGWGFWRADEPADPFVTVHVAHALVRAREEGFAVPDETLGRALEFLRTIDPRLPGEYGARVRAALSAYALYVRDRAGDPGAAEEARRLAALSPVAPSRDLPLEAAGWLLHVLADEAAAAAERTELLRYLRNRVTETAATATFAASYEEGEHLLLHSGPRSDAVILEALIAADPGSDLIPKVARGLLAHRVRGRWGSTQENAWVLLALERYFQAYERTSPDFRSRAWLGERFAGEHAFRGRTTERYHLEVPLREVVRADSAADLTLVREGEGRMYFRAGLRYAPADLSLDPLRRGFAVERAYEAVDDPADVRRDPDGTWRIRAGARVRVRVGMTAPSRRHHVALVDPLPAGLEPLNTALRGTGLAPDPPPDPRRPVRRPAPPRWASYWFSHRNLRDDRAEAFATYLPAGSYEYVYTARATTPGEFVVPPPRAEEMYQPETFGRGATDRVIVEEGPALP